MTKKADKVFGLSKKKLPWLVVLFLIGVVMLAVSSFIPGNEQDHPAVSEAAPGEQEKRDSAEAHRESTTGMAEAEALMETRLASILSKVEGVGQVSVTVTLENGPQYIYAVNQDINETKTEEKDSGGSSRVTVETTNSDQMVMAQPSEIGGQQPVVVKEIKPEIAGVLVAAEGARDAGVKETLARAVATLLDIPAHKVSILPKEVE